MKNAEIAKRAGKLRYDLERWSADGSEKVASSQWIIVVDSGVLKSIHAFLLELESKSEMR